MTNEEFKALNIGDRLRHKHDPSMVGNVSGNYGDRVTIVETCDVTAPEEWDIVYKMKVVSPEQT